MARMVCIFHPLLIRLASIRRPMNKLIMPMCLLVSILSAEAATYYITTSGNDSNSCTQAAPCRSFNRAYQVALSGDIVLVGAGTYGQQSLARNGRVTGTNSQTPDGNEVTFKPASGAGTVNVGGLSLSSVNSAASTAVDHVAFEDLTFTGFTLVAVANDVHFTRCNHRNNLMAVWASYISYRDGDLGSYTNSSGDGLQFYRDGAGNAGHHALVENMKIHGIRVNASDAHPDSIDVWGAWNNISFKRNKIWDNDGIHFRSDEGSRNHTIENNFFGRPVPGSVGNAGFTAQIVGAGNIIRYNTFDGPIQLGTAGYEYAFANQLWEGNLITGQVHTGCTMGTGTIARFNVWSTGNSSSCGTNNVRISSFSGWFVNVSTGDLHLTSLAVPTFGAGNPASFPATDIDGQERPTGGMPDAGAHEYGSTTSSGPNPPTGLTIVSVT
jgi:hypothetical protein